MGVFLRRSRAAKSAVGGPIWPKFELVRDIMDVLVLWMSSLPTNLKWILSIAAEKKWQHRFFRRSRAANSQVGSGIWPKFELIKALMHVLITCKYQKDRTLNSRDKMETPSFPL